MLTWIGVIIVIVFIVFNCIRPSPVNWYTHQVNGIELETPNTHQVRIGLTRGITQDLKFEIPFRVISFDGQWGSMGTGPQIYKQQLKIFLFPDSQFKDAPLRYRDAIPKLHQSFIDSKPFKETWEGLISQLVVFDYSLDPQHFNLVEESADAQTFLYNRRYDQSAFFILSKTQPYILALHFYGLTEEQAHERLRRIHSSLKIDWQKIRDSWTESSRSETVTVTGKPTREDYGFFVTTPDGERYFLDGVRYLDGLPQKNDELVATGILAERIVITGQSEAKIKVLESSTHTIKKNN